MVGGLEIVVGQAIELIVKDKPCVLHGILRTQTTHPAGKAGGRAAQHRDLAVTLCDEMGDCRFCCGPVIHTHHREVGEVQFIGNQRSQHGGNGDVCKAVLEVRDTAAQKDHALGLDLPQDLLGSIDLVGVLVQVGDDAVVPIQGSGPLQLNEEVGEEDVPGPLDHEHQAAGLLDLQLPRVGVGGKACLPHDLEHMLLGLGPDIRPVIDDARNGADRTAADAGNVLDRHIAGPRFRLDFRERCRERFQWL